MQRPNISNEAAEKIVTLTDKAVSGRQNAIEYVKAHDAIRALGYLHEEVCSRTLRVEIDYDSDVKSKGDPLGITVSSSNIRVVFKTAYGTETLKLEDTTDDRLAAVVAFVDSEIFAQAAINEAKSLTESGIAAGDSIE